MQQHKRGGLFGFVTTRLGHGSTARSERKIKSYKQTRDLIFHLPTYFQAGEGRETRKCSLRQEGENV